MKRKDSAQIPLYDYRVALQGALAAPLPRLHTQQAPYFTEPRRWHPVVVAGAIAKLAR
jgi:hypothetical protein